MPKNHAKTHSQEGQVLVQSLFTLSASRADASSFQIVQWPSHLLVDDSRAKCFVFFVIQIKCVQGGDVGSSEHVESIVLSSGVFVVIDTVCAAASKAFFNR